MNSELVRAADRGNMCSAREAKAAGLKAEYYLQPDFAGAPQVTRLEGPVEASWPEASELPSPGAVRSARWRGWIRPPLSGDYAFDANQSGVRIVVAGQEMVEGSATKVPLSAGRYHPITVEWRDTQLGTKAGQPPAFTLSWTAPHGARYPVPKTVMYPPSDTVADMKAPATPAAVPASATPPGVR